MTIENLKLFVQFVCKAVHCNCSECGCV